LSEDWAPGASIELLRERAALLARIRGFFAERDVLEVETPLLARRTVTDPHIDSFPVETPTGTRYLQTSPEFAMKRLLAAGIGDAYQICKAFRAEPVARLHNPEFSLLEWYRIGLDHHGLMNEVEALLRHVGGDRAPIGPICRLSYREAFARHAGVDPFVATEEECRAVAVAHGLEVTAAMSRDDWLDLLIGAVVAPAFDPQSYTFVYDFPEAQAALARVRVEDGHRVAERFELFHGPVELANGFHELIDVDEQRRRFERDCRARAAAGRVQPPIDEALLGAMAVGLPRCAGVALGLDRLLCALEGLEGLDQTISFAWERA
jgi:lysyl-tRNA synthetase class 2